MIRLLHLSDLHFDETDTHHQWTVPAAPPTGQVGTSPQRRSMTEAILDVVTPPFDGLLVTGDLTWSASEKEFLYARKEINKLASALRVPPNKILVIPGNHDVCWTLPPGERHDRFDASFELITKLEPQADHTQRILFESADERVWIMGVDSARLESKELAGIGLVGRDVLKKAFSGELGGLPKPTATILCMHHHLLPVTYMEDVPGEGQRTSVTLDAKAILDMCREHNVSLVLHGHQHQPTLAVYGDLDPLRSEKRKPSPLIWVCGSGTVGVKGWTGNARTNHFQVLELNGTSPDAPVKCVVTPYTLDHKDQYSFVQQKSTDITLNGTTPCDSFCSYARFTAVQIERAVIAPLAPMEHDTEAFLLLLNCRKCHETGDQLREKLKEDRGEKSEGPWVDAVYDLYGPYDILVKVRTPNKGDPHLARALVQEKVIDRLRAANLLDNSGTDSWGVLIDLREEHSRVQKARAFSEHRMIKAFVLFEHVPQSALMIHGWCVTAAEAVKRRPEYSSHVLLDGVYVSQDTVIAEYTLTCGGYYAMNDVVISIETVLERQVQKEPGARKVTLLAQTVSERHYPPL